MYINSSRVEGRPWLFSLFYVHQFWFDEGELSSPPFQHCLHAHSVRDIVRKTVGNYPVILQTKWEVVDEQKDQEIMSDTPFESPWRVRLVSRLPLLSIFFTTLCEQ